MCIWYISIYIYIYYGVFHKKNMSTRNRALKFKSYGCGTSYRIPWCEVQVAYPLGHMCTMLCTCIPSFCPTPTYPFFSLFRTSILWMSLYVLTIWFSLSWFIPYSHSILYLEFACYLIIFLEFSLTNLDFVHDQQSCALLQELLHPHLKSLIFYISSFGLKMCGKQTRMQTHFIKSVILWILNLL